MKKVYQILGFSNEDYEQFIITFWMRWCESVTIDHREFLRVFSNASVNKWFMEELKKCESEFLSIAKNYEDPENRNLRELKICFDDITFKMYSIFPKALLADAKKLEDKTIKGIPVNKLTILQN